PAEAPPDLISVVSAAARRPHDRAALIGAQSPGKQDHRLSPDPAPSRGERRKDRLTAEASREASAA
ncbi:MAG TPA: hypothetical protein VIT02_13050, partial [Burkholderiaceae bacterium]